MSKPTYLRNIEMLAQESGQEHDALVTRLKTRARGFVEDGVDCFLPDEITEYERTGTIHGGRMEHTNVCASCAALIDDFIPENAATGPVAAASDPKEEVRETISGGSSKALADRLWSYDTIAGTAAVLVLGAIFSLKYGSNRIPTTPVEPNRITTAPVGPSRVSTTPVEVRLSDKRGKQRVAITVMASGGKIASEYYADVAAAATVAEGAAGSNKPNQKKVQGFVNLDMTPDELSKVSRALSKAFQDNENEKVEVPQLSTGIDKGVLNALVRSFANTNINVAVLKNGELALYRNEAQVAFVKPAVAMQLTATYDKILKDTAGDTRVLDDRVRGIRFDLVVSSRQPPQPYK